MATDWRFLAPYSNDQDQDLALRIWRDVVDSLDEYHGLPWVTHAALE
jgi:hypothetical protein